MKLSRLSAFWAIFVMGLSGRINQVWAANEFCPGFGADSSDPRVNTALGCVPVSANDFVAWLLSWLFGVAGGIAFLLMIYGFIMMATTKGDPKAMQAARETIGSAVTGLLVSVFAVFLLRLITVDILHIPGIN
ncbi:hypothetical protein KJ909_01080 [Patescibacteria group bacterium]|nr:hypothetical protein [Patescibacteria group bacterium]